jgi:surface polysaccharide O-acyltransferase-like enzyme
MNKRNPVRISTVIIFLLLSTYFVKYPIFKDTDISNLEEDTIPLYFFEVVGKSGSGYIVMEGTSKNEIEVVTDAVFEMGNIVSFYGTIENNRLIVQKHHLHKYSSMRIYLSLIGLIAFVYLMMRGENNA